jgi:hypothetical protein
VLKRLFAYSVTPQKGMTSPVAPAGGALTTTGPLGSVVSSATQKAPASSWLDVSLRVDTSTGSRAHPVRDAVIHLATASDKDADAAALVLARRLSTCMDGRMKGCLLALAVEAMGAGYAVTLWTFPQEDALRFVHSSSASRVDVLRDVFSQTSSLRKAAVVRGSGAGPTEFLTARVVDLQTGGYGTTADYWIDNFLDAQLSLADGIGSAALARGLKAAWDAAKSQDERDQFYAAAIAIRASTASRTSLKVFADEYLTGTAKATFLKTSEARQHKARQFRFDKASFDHVVNFRVVETSNGLRISAPFADADGLLSWGPVLQDGTREVTATGVVVADKVAARA